MEEIKKNYVIIIYTASHKSYADSVLDFLDPKKEIYQYRLYRHNCVEAKVEGDTVYIKDLRVIKNVAMSDMIIIDNSVMSFAYQLENGIPILPYYDNPNDLELKYLANYLNRIAKHADLRTENKKIIKMDYFLKTVNEEQENSVCDEYFTNQSQDSNYLGCNDNALFKLKLLNRSATSNKKYSSERSNASLNNISQSVNNSVSEMYLSNSSDNTSNEIIVAGANNSSLFKKESTIENDDDLGYKVNFKMPKRPSVFKETLFKTLDDMKKLSGKLD